jgi:ribosomal protein S18 acetylase RimI-like enzyme
MRREELIELSDLNFAEANREFSRRAGGTVHDEDGLLLFAGGHPLPVSCNAVMRTGGDLPAGEVRRRADAFFGARRRGYTVTIRAHADADLRAPENVTGLVEFFDSPAMVLLERLTDAVPPPGMTLRRVESGADAAAFAEVMGAAYASLGMPDGVAPAILGPAVLTAPHFVTFLVRLGDGTPVAGAMCVLTHGVAGVYWVGTVPAARGRGLAELCTRAAGNAGFDMGARVAALQASVMGESVYRRMGYVEVTRYLSLVRFEPPPSP